MEKYLIELIRFSELWAAENENKLDKVKDPIDIAQRILNILRTNDIHIYFNNGFYVYYNGCYRYTTHDNMIKILLPIICCLSDTGINTPANKKRKVIDELSMFHYPLLKEPELHNINFKNFAFDIKENKKLPERRNIFFKYVLPYDARLQGDVEPARFLKFFSEILSEEYRQFIINYIYSMFLNVKTETVPFFFGYGSNGKSTLIDLIVELVGRDNCSFASIDDLINKSNSEYYLSQIEGKLLNVCADNTTFIQDEGRLKTLVSKEPIMARNPYEGVRMIKDIPSFIFSFNKLPYLTDYSYGMLRRIVVVPFNQTFSPNANLLYELKKELPYIFSYILRNAQHERILRGVLASDEIKSRTKIYLSMSDSVTLFMINYSKNIYGATAINSVYSEYKYFCGEYGYNKCNYETFKERLKKNGVKFNNKYVDTSSVEEFTKMAKKLRLIDMDMNDILDDNAYLNEQDLF